MRSEKEMLEMILDKAKHDENIRAVYLEGSRANREVKKDKYQDFDVNYIVRDKNEFKFSPEEFGDIMIYQIPQEGTWLMQFQDGNRIDLNIKEEINVENYIVLMDKDHLFEKKENFDLSMFYSDYPSESEFNHCCNEFYWVLTYVIKGIKRNELVYANNMLDLYVRPQLFKMVNWVYGRDTNLGYQGKFFNKLAIYDDYLKTYTLDKPSLFLMCDLFESTAKQLTYIFNQEEADNVVIYLQEEL